MVTKSRALVPVLVLIGMVTAVVSSLGAPLLPTIARVDHVTLGDAQWSLTVTMLVGAITAPVLGRLGDGPQRKPVMMAALALVLVGSVIAAVPSNSFALLLVGRALHGFGLGLMPLNMAVARDNLPEAKAASAIAILSIATVAGAGLGYPVTGVLDQTLGLHAAFWFGAISSAAVLAVALPVLPSSRHLPRRRLDMPGAALLGAALLAVLLAVTEGQPWGWGSPRVIVLLVIGAAVGTGWVVWELRAAQPLVQLRLVRHPAVSVTNASAFLIAMAMYIYLPLLTDLVQTPRGAGYGFGSTVIVTGLMLLPFSFLSTSMSRVAMVMGRRFGEHVVVPTGSLVLGLAIGLFAVTKGTLWEGFIDMGLAGVGVGFTFAAMPGLIVRSVPAEETGSALGFYQVVRYVGFSFGSGISATILAVYTPMGALLPRRAGFSVALAVGAGICLAAGAASIFPSRRRSATPVAVVAQDAVGAEIAAD